VEGISRGTAEKDRERLEELRTVHAALQQMKEEWDAWHR